MENDSVGICPYENYGVCDVCDYIKTYKSCPDYMDDGKRGICNNVTLPEFSCEHFRMMGYCPNGFNDPIPVVSNNKIANLRGDVINEAIREIKSQLNDTDRYWKGMQKSIKILERIGEN